MRAKHLDPRKIILIVSALLVIILAGYILRHLAVYRTAAFHREKLFDGAPETPSFSGDFLAPTAEITVVAIHSGDLNVMLSNPIDLTNPAFAGIADRSTTVPVYAYLIHHEKYGYFLIDSGCSSDYADNPYGTMSGLLVSRFVPPTSLDPADAIDVQLAETLADIRGVFFTHLHFDHTSGVPSLPPGIPFFAGKNDTYYNIVGLLEAHHFDSSDTMYLFDFEEGLDLPLGRAIDIFGDQTVWAVSTPGHSAGHVSYLINTPDRPIFIAGDAVNTDECLALCVRSGTSSSNPVQDQQTVDRLTAYFDEHPEIEVWCGHGEAMT